VFSEAYGNTLFCDTCVVQDKCPKFEKGMACAFNFKPNFVTSNPLATLDFIISAQMERVQRMMLFESLEGGQVNKTLSYEISLLEKLNASRVNLIALAQLKNLTMGGRDTSALQDPAVAGEASFANILLGMMNKPK
jgi:hypothetical protein